MERGDRLLLDGEDVGMISLPCPKGSALVLWDDPQRWGLKHPFNIDVLDAARLAEFTLVPMVAGHGRQAARPATPTEIDRRVTDRLDAEMEAILNPRQMKLF